MDYGLPGDHERIIQVLNREPTDPELACFENIWRNTAVTRQLVIYS